MTTILSIQSSVAYGHVGNSAATFPLMRLGVEVWPVNTVHFSNHTGYGAWRGTMLAASDIADVITGIEERGVLERVDGVLSGYQGGADVGAEILRTVERVRAHQPNAIYCCDPVLGDVGRGIYVRSGIPEFMRDHVIPAAQIVTPNHFELDYLTGNTTTTIEEVVAAAQQLRARGPEVVLVTSAVLEGGDEDEILMVVVTAAGVWKVATPRLERSFTGSGDLTAALFLAHYLESADPADAMGRTADAVFSLLQATTNAGSAELLLVAAQSELVSPSSHFEVVRVS